MLKIINNAQTFERNFFSLIRYKIIVYMYTFCVRALIK